MEIAHHRGCFAKYIRLGLAVWPMDTYIGKRVDLTAATSSCADLTQIHHLQQLACPIIFLQRLDDPVVPTNQTHMMYEAVRVRYLTVALLTFPGEEHGFVKAENNKRALEAELYFYSKIFKFEPAGRIEPIPIENL